MLMKIVNKKQENIYEKNGKIKYRIGWCLWPSGITLWKFKFIYNYSILMLG